MTLDALLCSDSCRAELLWGGLSAEEEMKEEFEAVPPDPPDPPRSPSDLDGRALAVSALKSLKGSTGSVAPIALEGLERLSIEELTDLVLDQRETLDFEVWIECVAALIHPRFDDLTRTTCEREYLLLNPGRVADLALGRFIALFRLGRRIRPCSRWLRQILEESITWARFRPGFCIYRANSSASTDERMQASLAQTVNELDALSRRIVHLSWIQRMKPDRVAETTQLPLEEVECVLEGVLRVVVKLVTGHDYSPAGEAGSPQFWKQMEPREDEEEKEGEHGQ